MASESTMAAQRMMKLGLLAVVALLLVTFVSADDYSGWSQGRATFYGRFASTHAVLRARSTFLATLALLATFRVSNDCSNRRSMTDIATGHLNLAQWTRHVCSSMLEGCIACCARSVRVSMAVCSNCRPTYMCGNLCPSYSRR